MKPAYDGVVAALLMLLGVFSLLAIVMKFLFLF